MKGLKPAREVFRLELQGAGVEAVGVLWADPGELLKGWRRVEEGRKCSDGNKGGPGD